MNDHLKPGIGGAVGHTELTIDLDFWYNLIIDNLLKLIKALADLEVDTPSAPFLAHLLLSQGCATRSADGLDKIFNIVNDTF